MAGQGMSVRGMPVQGMPDQSRGGCARPNVPRCVCFCNSLDAGGRGIGGPAIGCAARAGPFRSFKMKEQVRELSRMNNRFNRSTFCMGTLADCDTLLLVPPTWWHPAAPIGAHVVPLHLPQMRE